MCLCLFPCVVATACHGLGIASLGLCWLIITARWYLNQGKVKDWHNRLCVESILLGLKLWTCILEANDVVTTIQIYSSPCANAPLMQRRSPSWCWRDPRPASSLSSNHRRLVKVDILSLIITTWNIVKFLILCYLLRLPDSRENALLSGI